MFDSIIGLIISLIISLTISIVGIVYIVRSKQEEEQKRLKIEENERRRIEDERRRIENEKIRQKQRLDCMKNKWRDTDIYKTIVSEVTEFTKEHIRSIDGCFLDQYNVDVVCVVVRHRDICVYHYSGIRGNGVEAWEKYSTISYKDIDFYGKPRVWNYDENGLSVLSEFNLNKLGFENLDDEQMKALSEVLLEGLKQQVKENNVEISNKNIFGYIVLDFDNCYCKLKSVL